MKLKLIYTLLIGFVSLASFAQIDRSKAPKAQPNPEIKIQKPNVFELDNGLKVIVVENHKLPKVSFQLYVDHQPVKEGDKAGMSNLFGELLGSGTKNLNKDQFDQNMDFMGADFYPSARGFFASSLTKHTEKLLGLLSDVVLNPAFPSSEFDRLKEQTLSGIKSESSDPNSMASNVSDVINYGTAMPYGEVVTEKTVENISLEDIQKHYSTYFKPNISYLVVVGDINEEKAKSLANKYFGSWQKGEVPTQQYTIQPQNKSNQVIFVDKPGAVQSVINITQPINIKPGDADEIKLKVFNAILGGGSFSARLMSNLREDKAYTYGCYSRVYPDELIGEFYAGGSFRNEVTDSAITQIMYEITNIYNNPVKASELDLVKKSMTGAFARSLENPQTIARFALNTIRYNLDENYYTNYLKNLEKITIKDLQEVGKKYLNPNGMNIVVVGNAEIAEKLIQFDSDGKVDYRNAFGEIVTPLKAVPDGVTAQSIIESFLFKSFIVNSQAEIDAKMKKIGYVHTQTVANIKEMGVDLILDKYQAKPNKSAAISKAGGNVMQKEWFNGTKGRTFVMMQGSEALTDDEIKEKQAQGFPFEQMAYFKDKSLNIELLGIEEVDGKEYYKLKIQREGDEDFSYEYYNTQTGFLEIVETFMTDEEGNSNTIKVTINSYSVYGKGKSILMLPAKSTMNMQGRDMVFETTTVEIKKKSKSKVFEGEF